MPFFIYITDVFCPWCFGFAPVMRRLAAAHPFPVRVLCGNLVDEPADTSTMGTPRLRAFFQRLSDTTGRPLGEGFFRLLEEGQGVAMDSSRSALLMAALKKLAPGRALEQMETFQEAFYKDGLDVLSLSDQAKVAARWGIGKEDLEAMLLSEKTKNTAEHDMAEAEDILGDFVVYPSLFVKTDDGVLHAVARGYAPFEEVEAKIEEALLKGASLSEASAHACGLDGCCS
ncbi:DsbA family protein [Mailhella massiliensis]|uniref:DsbA family protein n=1 Tax=Mailhella massiliensis TaxID=1903261 RepID=A0A921AWP3_9BACT|nr:DsbA family protein [Mailhella massiliensis]HJD97710.1 DsbA family protein [Mailhella massiliensis]